MLTNQVLCRMSSRFGARQHWAVSVGRGSFRSEGADRGTTEQVSAHHSHVREYTDTVLIRAITVRFLWLLTDS